MAGLLQDRALLGDDIVWMEALRQKGQVAFEHQGIPTPKTEAWKYTRVRALSADDFVMPEAEEPVCSCGCHHHEGECCHHHDEQSCSCRMTFPFSPYVCRFKNGNVRALAEDLPQGVTVMPLMDAIFREDDDIKTHLGKLIDVEKYPFAALNTAYMEQGLFVRVERGVKLDKPLVLDVFTKPEGQNLFYNLRHLIVIEKGAEAEIFENYHYHGEVKSRYFVNIVSEIYIGRNARLRHYKFQDDAFKACHVGLAMVNVKEAGDYRHFCCQKGADIGRDEVIVRLSETEAHARVDAAYKMSGWATLDTTTDIQHLAERTYSEQLVKAVVDGDAKGVFQGRIHIAPDSQQVEGTQLHKALLLSDRAEVDVKPELEIFADDVKCSHGAASGEMDEEQLFYMQSRGIGADEARQILVDAFLDDVLIQVEDEQVRNWFKEKM